MDREGGRGRGEREREREGERYATSRRQRWIDQMRNASAEETHPASERASEREREGGRKGGREGAQCEALGESRAYARLGLHMTCMSAESPISFRSAIVAPRSVRRFVGRRRSGLTRTELCHRAAPCYEAIIQRARGNMRLPAAYAGVAGDNDVPCTHCTDYTLYRSLALLPLPEGCGESQRDFGTYRRRDRNAERLRAFGCSERDRWNRFESKSLLQDSEFQTTSCFSCRLAHANR